MFRKLWLALALASVATMAHAQTAQTRSYINTQNNTKIVSNGNGGITAPILNTLLGTMNASYGVLNDTNVWTGANTFTSPTINTPNIVGDNLTINPTSAIPGVNLNFYSPYYVVGGSNSWGFGLTSYGPVPGTGQRLGAFINPGATHVTNLAAMTGDIDFAVRNGSTDTMELYSLFAGTSGVPGGFIPDVDNQQTLGEYNYAWKYIVGHSLIAEDATLPTLTLNNTTANGSETIAYQNNGTATFGLNGYYTGGANNWGLYDTGTTGGASYDIIQISNGATTIQPYGAIYLSPRNGYVISSQLIVAPDVELTPVSIATLLTISCGAGTEGTVAYVKDTVGAAAPTFHLTVAGGGANAVHSLASCNGTSWQYD